MIEAIISGVASWILISVVRFGIGAVAFGLHFNRRL